MCIWAEEKGGSGGEAPREKIEILLVEIQKSANEFLMRITLCQKNFPLTRGGLFSPNLKSENLSYLGGGI